MHLLDQELFCAKTGAVSGAGLLHGNQSAVNAPVLGNTRCPGVQWHGVHLCESWHM